MPGNANRVIPELLLVSNRKQIGQIEAPTFQYTPGSSQSCLYNNCPAMCFYYYLDRNNKTEMELLVRKLNILLNQQ